MIMDKQLPSCFHQDQAKTRRSKSGCNLALGQARRYRERLPLTQLCKKRRLERGLMREMRYGCHPS
jgi:hypothetical protein